jgi:hypothetical protein
METRRMTRAARYYMLRRREVSAPLRRRSRQALFPERSRMGTLWLAVIIVVVLALFMFGVRGRVS